MQLKYVSFKYALLAVLAIPAFAAQTLPPITVDNPADLIGGPAVVNAGPRSATVVWLTKTGDLGTTSDAATLQAMVKVNTKEFKDLTPGTEYDYEFRGTDTVHGRFFTAPEGQSDFEFIAYGDTRSRHDIHQQVVDEMVKYNPAFVVHTGDVVANGTHTDQWAKFFDIEKQLLAKTDVFPAAGNHEHQAPQYFDFLAAKGHYSFNWGRAHFAIIDSNVDQVAKEKREAFWTDQKNWLDDDLASARNADFRFVIMHHPPFSASRAAINKEARELVPIFEKRAVTAVFAGHDHNYQRHVKDGIQYIVTGGGGAPLYDVKSPIPDITVTAVKTENFVRVQVKGNTAIMTAIGKDGQQLDQVQVQAAPNAMPLATGH